MSARESIAGLFELGFAESALQPSTPDREDVSGHIRTPSIVPTPRPSAYLLAKRSLDVTLSGVMLLASLPILIIVAVAVRLTSRGPIIFSQDRLTEGGRIFRMYKFRTMRIDAESVSGPVWAKERDPRVTPVGRFLRLSHLDELPQLFNVIKGDMSIVGPRPERPELAAELEEQLPSFHKRLAVKGGITGLAQVSAGYAGNIQSYRTKLSYDLLYVNKRSFLLDLGILFRTVIVVLTGMGAR